MIRRKQRPVVHQLFTNLWFTTIIFRTCRYPVSIFVNRQCIRHIVLDSSLLKCLQFIHVATKHQLNVFLVFIFHPVSLSNTVRKKGMDTPNLTSNALVANPQLVLFSLYPISLRLYLVTTTRTLIISASFLSVILIEYDLFIVSNSLGMK